MNIKTLENKYIYILLGLVVLFVPLAYLYVFILLVRQWIHRDYRVLGELKNNKLLSLVSLCCVVSMALVRYRLISLAVGSLGLICILTICYIYSSNEHIDSDFVIKLLYILAVIVCIFGIFQMVNPNYVMPKKWVDASEYNIKKRMFSTFFNPNVFGFFLNMILIILFTDFKNMKSWTEVGLLRAVTFLLCIICLFYTFSRTCWVSLIAVLIIEGLLIDKKYLQFAIIIAVYIIACDLLSGIGRADIGKLSGDTSLAYRIELWRTGLQIIKDNFVIGIGFGTFFKYTPLYSVIITKYIEHCHNIYLQVLIETGIIGFIIVFSTFCKLCKNLGEQYKKDKSDILTASMIKIILMALIHGLVDSVCLTPQIMLLLSCMIGITLSQDRRLIKQH